jgi:S-DNA-T family DNA segregation ATPase FtsK/SpoIIIE
MVAGPREVQVVLPEIDRAASLASAWPPDGAPRRIERLPARIPLAALDTPGAIGVSGEDLGPVTIDTRPGAHLVVLGEPASGRSTALATIAAAHLSRPGTSLAILAWRPGPLEAVADRAAAVALTAADADQVLAAVEAKPDGCLLVLDDAEELPPALGDRLERLLRSARTTGLRVAVAARAAEWSRLFDPWARYLGSLGTAIVLSRMAELAPAFGVRPAPPFAPPAPGRGYLITGGAVLPLQLATLESVSDVARS